MPVRPLSTLSQSSLQDYADCPQRFKLRYIDRLSYPALESEPALENEKNQLEGQYFHRLVQESMLGMGDGKLARLATSANVSRWWQNFVDQRPALDDYTLYTEYVLSAPLGPVRLTAKYDLLAVRPGTALIYDWKTYRTRPRDDRLAARWQTRVYMALLAHAGAFLAGGAGLPSEKIQMIYWFAEFPSDPAVFTYTSDQFHRDWQTLLSLAGEIVCAPDYPPAEDLAPCQYCVYRSFCGRGGCAPQGYNGDTELSSDSLYDLNFEQIGEIAF